MVACISPLRAIVTDLFRQPTEMLIQFYEKAINEEKDEPKAISPRKQTSKSSISSPSRSQAHRCASILTMDELVEELEREELKLANGTRSQELDPEPLSTNVVDKRDMPVILHPLGRFKHHASSRDKDLPPPPQLEASNPFVSSTGALSSRPRSSMSSYVIMNTIARRAGYGNDNYFHAGRSGLLNAVVGGDKGQQQSGDKEAYLFMKKYGMKRWIGKRTEKAEELMGKARDKLDRFLPGTRRNNSGQLEQ